MPIDMVLEIGYLLLTFFGDEGISETSFHFLGLGVNCVCIQDSSCLVGGGLGFRKMGKNFLCLSLKNKGKNIKLDNVIVLI